MDTKESNYHGLTSCFILFSIALVIYKTLISNRGNGRHRLPLPPSPFAIPIIGHLHLLPPIPHQSLHSLSLRLGPLFHLRLGSVPCIAVSSPDIARENLKNQETSFLDRPPSKTLAYLTYDSSFGFCPHGPYWRFMRRIAVHQLLSPKTLLNLSPVRHEEMRKFVEGLHEMSRRGASVNVGREVVGLLLNAISRVAVGRRLSEETWGMIKENAALAGSFNLQDYIGAFRRFDLQGIEKRAVDLHERYDRMIEGVIAEKEGRRREEEGSEERVKDLLDMMLDIAEEESAEIKLTRNHIKAFVQDIIQAGTETSASAIEWGLSELINNPTALQKAREEVDAVVGGARVVCESDVPSLPYIQAIMKETLRLHPSLPILLRHSTADCEIAGYRIPSNTRVFINAWSIGRSPEHWENPLQFLPERFLESGAVDFMGQHFQLLPFGSGRRGCPGVPLALHMVHVALAAMVQCFEWRVEGGGGAVDMSEGAGLSLLKAKPLVCTLAARLNPM